MNHLIYKALQDTDKLLLSSENYMFMYLTCLQDPEKAKLLLSRYNYLVRDLNAGLEGACRAGNIQLVEIIISKGANGWDNGLLASCEELCQLDIVSLMISKGASENCRYWCLIRAFNLNNISLFELILQHDKNNKLNMDIFESVENEKYLLFDKKYLFDYRKIMILCKFEPVMKTILIKQTLCIFLKKLGEDLTLLIISYI